MLVDIAFNASSKEYQKCLPTVFEKSKSAGILPLIVGLDLESSRAAIQQAENFGTWSYFGIHPTSFRNVLKDTKEEHSVRYAVDELLIDPEAVRVKSADGGSKSTAFHAEPLQDILLKGIRTSNRVIAIGECGLDYFRKSNREEQIKVFKAHLALHKHVDLPFFFHCRQAAEDFIKCFDELKPKVPRGVVHSFDGPLSEAEEFMNRGLYIGINGCSIRSEEGVSVIRKIPLERILLETDSPYCLIRGSYAGSRFTNIIKAKHNQPYFLKNIATAIANIKGVSVDEVERITYNNTIKLFPILSTASPHQ